MTPVVYGLDLESTGLKMDFASILTVGLQQIDLENPGNHRYEPLMFAIQDYVKPPVCQYRHPIKDGHLPVDDDKALLEAVWPVIGAADMIVTWFGKGFDVKALNARGVFHGLPALPPIPHTDLYFTAKMNFNISSNRLQSWEEFLNLTDKKTPLLRAVWRAAAAGDPTALKYVTDHCRADVILLDSVYAKLRPFVRLHPRMSGPDLGRCRVCQSTKLQLRGEQLTLNVKARKRRVSCSQCGSWDLREIAWQP